MMFYVDFKKTQPPKPIEIANDLLLPKIWINPSWKSFSSFSFVVDEVLANELQ